MRTLFLASTIALLGLSSTAEAHFILTSPAPSNPADNVKTTPDPGSNEQSGKGPPPCGPDATPATMPTAAQGGHPLKLMLTETVRHGGFYRVALSLNSRSELPVDNVVYDASNKVLPPSGTPSGTSDHADTEATPVFPVLGDNLFLHDQNGAQNIVYQMDIMLPNVTCAHCTLQVIEFMHPHGFNAGGGYFYHHCADLKITADPALPAFGADGGTTETHPDAGTDTSGAGGKGGNTGGAAGTSGAGGTGSAGTSGSAGSGNTAGVGGQAGDSATGTSGTSGSAGSGTAGTSSTTGAAGTGSGTTGSHSSGGGGCSISGNGEGATLVGVIAVLGIALSLRRRRS